MIKLDNVGRKAIYFTSPYFSNIDLTGAYVKFVKWDKSDKEGIMIATKENASYKIGLFPQTYQGHDDLKNKTIHSFHQYPRRIKASLSQVGEGHFKLGYIYNIKQID